jgi:hypothetical protein
MIRATTIGDNIKKDESSQIFPHFGGEWASFKNHEKLSLNIDIKEKPPPLSSLLPG